MKIIFIFSVLFAAYCNEILSQGIDDDDDNIDDVEETTGRCPRIWDPFCGRSTSDGTLETFSNLCYLLKEPGYEPYGHGYCQQFEKLDMRKRSTPYPADFPKTSPVCAKKSDGTFKEFSSYSLFEAENQSSKGEYTWFRNGPCVEKKPAVKPIPVRPLPMPHQPAIEPPAIDEVPIPEP